MMSRHSQRELAETIRPPYLRATKTGKEQFLYKFVAISGYRRKYAFRLFKKRHQSKGRKMPWRGKVYQGKVVTLLGQI
jgi:hypothetical protein